MLNNISATISAGLHVRSSAVSGIKTRSLWVLLFLLCIVSSRSASADPRPHFEEKITLESIKASDLGLSSSSLTAGEITVDSYGQAALPGLTAEMFSDPTKVTRKIDKLWEWKILKNKNEEIPYFTTEYIVIGSNGSRNTFSSSIDPSSTIGVSLEKKGVVVQEDKNNQWIVGESVELLLDLADVNRSGQYSGSISALVTISNY
ncbi:MAG: hypothetical protein HGA72_10970 [Chlorobiaceae bacterium]|nr:hypothetical protein [Chlorobiaceae bacterium]